MTDIDLSAAQRTVLDTLVDLHQVSDAPVKGEVIAERVDRNPGTIRNQMQSLRSLDLVDGVPGPRGGYRPTSNAYDVLGRDRIDDPADVPLVHEGERVEDATVQEIELVHVDHPEQCRARVHVGGPVSGVRSGDSVVLGPTPVEGLLVDGTVVGTTDRSNALIIAVDRMTAPADS